MTSEEEGRRYVGVTDQSPFDLLKVRITLDQSKNTFTARSNDVDTGTNNIVQA